MAIKRPSTEQDLLPGWSRDGKGLTDRALRKVPSYDAITYRGTVLTEIIDRLHMDHDVLIKDDYDPFALNDGTIPPYEWSFIYYNPDRDTFGVAFCGLIVSKSAGGFANAVEFKWDGAALVAERALIVGTFNVKLNGDLLKEAVNLVVVSRLQIARQGFIVLREVNSESD